MDYMYGELNDLVTNLNYTGLRTDTANTVVDGFNRTIKVDVNFDDVDIKNTLSYKGISFIDGLESGLMRLHHVAAPEVDTDATNKIYVDECLSTKADKSNTVTTNTEQNITGTKYFTSGEFRDSFVLGNYRESPNSISLYYEGPQNPIAINAVRGFDFKAPGYLSTNVNAWKKVVTIGEDTTLRCGLEIVGNGLLLTSPSSGSGRYLGDPEIMDGKSNFGLKIPDTTLWTSSKIIATQDEVDTKVSLNNTETITGHKTFSNVNGIAISNGSSAIDANLYVTNQSGDGELFIDGVRNIMVGDLYATGVHASNARIDWLGGDIDEIIHTDTNSTRIASSGASYGVKFPDTSNWAADKLLTTEVDLGNNLFTVTDPDITVDMQHSYQIGNLIFVHLVFHRASAPADTGTYKIGTLSKHALHQHSFAVSGYNSNTGNTLNEAGVLTTSGDVKIHFTKSTATSNVQFDAEFFFCEGH